MLSTIQVILVWWHIQVYLAFISGNKTLMKPQIRVHLDSDISRSHFLLSLHPFAIGPSGHNSLDLHKLWIYLITVYLIGTSAEILKSGSCVEVLPQGPLRGLSYTERGFPKERKMRVSHASSVFSCFASKPSGLLQHSSHYELTSRTNKPSLYSTYSLN